MHNEASEFTNKENIMKEKLKDVFLITPIFLMIKLVRPIMPDDNPLKKPLIRTIKNIEPSFLICLDFISH